MDPEKTYERRQSAALTESVMLVASGIGVLAAVVALLHSSFFPAFGLLLLSLISFAQSRLLLLMDSLFTSVGQIQKAGGPIRQEQETDEPMKGA